MRRIPASTPQRVALGTPNKEETETEEDAVGCIDSGLKEKVLADAGGGTLQRLGHRPNAAHAGEAEDAMPEVFAFHQEVDSENDDYAESPDRAQKAHEELDSGLEFVAIGVHNADGLGLRE